LSHFQNYVIDEGFLFFLDEHFFFVGKSQTYRIDSIINGLLIAFFYSPLIEFNMEMHNNRSIKLNNNEVVNLHWCMPLLPKGWSFTKFCLLFIHTIKIFIIINLQFICSLLLIFLVDFQPLSDNNYNNHVWIELSLSRFSVISLFTF